MQNEMNSLYEKIEQQKKIIDDLMNELSKIKKEYSNVSQNEFRIKNDETNNHLW